ncbi:MAG: DegT/DnrJ/EryC1/StrS family aminotransferase [Nitrospinae bacterium]|nr:DegT/DnrJ/EryC1/StrS family aminotransferase [Nitrospinota bacterium]
MKASSTGHAAPKPVKTVPIALPSTGEEEWRALLGPLSTGWLTQGPKVAEFEKAFALRQGVKHAVATTSCTTALHLILKAAGIGPGDEVIVPSFTWVATANAVEYCGATPVFADIDPATFNIGHKSAGAKVASRTKAVIAVHLFGLCADMDLLAEAVKGAIIVEDAACAAGGSFKGQPAGSLGVAGAFSFHPRKIITTGEGGMITTNDGALAGKVNMLRNHGASSPEEARHQSPKPYLLPDFNDVGFNYRMTDLQGAVGLVQLRKLDGFLAERRRWAQYYMRELADIGWLRLPNTPEGHEHGWQAFVTMVDEDKAPAGRDEIMDRLAAMGVATRPGTHAAHTLGYYSRRYGLKPADCPNAYACATKSMAIPLHNRMDESDYAYVVDCLKSLR